MAEWVEVASADDVGPGECTVVEAKGKPIALHNVDGTFYATDNTCLHQGGPLGEGFLEGETVTCPWHGWQYNVTTGANVDAPELKVLTFDVKVENGKILVEI